MTAGAGVARACAAAEVQLLNCLGPAAHQHPAATHLNSTSSIEQNDEFAAGVLLPMPAGSWARPPPETEPAGRGLQQLQLPTFNGTNVANVLGISNTAGPTVFRTAPITGGSVLPVPVPAGSAASPNPAANAAGGNLTIVNGTGVNGTGVNGTATGPADTAAQGEAVMCK